MDPDWQSEFGQRMLRKLRAEGFDPDLKNSPNFYAEARYVTGPNPTSGDNRSMNQVMQDYLRRAQGGAMPNPYDPLTERLVNTAMSPLNYDQETEVERRERLRREAEMNPTGQGLMQKWDATTAQAKASLPGAAPAPAAPAGMPALGQPRQPSVRDEAAYSMLRGQLELGPNRHAKVMGGPVRDWTEQERSAAQSLLPSQAMYQPLQRGKPIRFRVGGGNLYNLNDKGREDPALGLAEGAEEMQASYKPVATISWADVEKELTRRAAQEADTLAVDKELAAAQRGREGRVLDARTNADIATIDPMAKLQVAKGEAEIAGMGTDVELKKQTLADKKIGSKKIQVEADDAERRYRKEVQRDEAIQAFRAMQAQATSPESDGGATVTDDERYSLHAAESRASDKMPMAREDWAANEARAGTERRVREMQNKAEEAKARAALAQSGMQEAAQPLQRAAEVKALIAQDPRFSAFRRQLQQFLDPRQMQFDDGRKKLDKTRNDLANYVFQAFPGLTPEVAHEIVRQFAMESGLDGDLSGQKMRLAQDFGLR